MTGKISRQNVTQIAFWPAIARTVVPWLLPVILLLIWQIAANIGWLEKRILPAPSAVVVAFWHLLLSGELFIHVRVSAGRAP